MDFFCDIYERNVEINLNYSTVPRGFDPADHKKLKGWTCSGMDSCGYSQEDCPNKDKFINENAGR